LILSNDIGNEHVLSASLKYSVPHHATWHLTISIEGKRT